MPTEYSLTSHQLLRPAKVRWILDQKETALASIKSKTTRKFLTNIDQLLVEAGIIYSFAPLTQDQYATWYEYYQQKMRENNFEILAKPEWYSQKIAAGDSVFGLFLYQSGQLIGSAIIHLADNQSSMSYKASDKIELTKDPNSSLGAVIDYFYIKEMLAQQVPTITSGRSRNAFGVINKLGYLDYKLKFGFYPIVENPADSTDVFLLNELGFGVSFCHSANQTHLTMIQACPEGAEQSIEASRFAGEHFEYQVITYPANS